MTYTILSYVAAAVAPSAYVAWRLKGDRSWSEAVRALGPIWRPK